MNVYMYIRRKDYLLEAIPRKDFALRSLLAITDQSVIWY